MPHQKNVLSVLSRILLNSYGPDFPADEVAILSFKALDELGAINWFRVDPDDSMFQIVDGAEPHGPLVRTFAGQDVVSK
jgi:hypothetical protein